jgi:hypothetical protein
MEVVNKHTCFDEIYVIFLNTFSHGRHLAAFIKTDWYSVFKGNNEWQGW